MSDIVQLPGTERNVVPLSIADDVPSKDVLEYAIYNEVEDVIVVGIDTEGDLYLAASSPDLEHVYVRLELAQRYILKLLEEKDIEIVHV